MYGVNNSTITYDIRTVGQERVWAKLRDTQVIGIKRTRDSLDVKYTSVKGE